MINSFISRVKKIISRKKNISNDILRPIDVRLCGNSPFSLSYMSLPRPVVCDMPLNLGRGFRVLPLELNSYHPFIVALLQASKATNMLATIRNGLETYYRFVQPKNPCDWINIQNSRSGLLQRCKPHALSMPWDLKNPQQWEISREKFVKDENLMFKKTLGIEGGFHFWGPVSNVKLEVEALRLSNIYSSILNNGYMRDDNQGSDVRAVVLKKNNCDWRWQVCGGEHRAAAALVAGYSVIPVRVIQIVYLDDVDIWPGVLHGYYSKSEALQVFGQVFNGIYPFIFQQWIGQLSKNVF